jgi:hypothetical protein
MSQKADQGRTEGILEQNRMCEIVSSQHHGCGQYTAILFEPRIGKAGRRQDLAHTAAAEKRYLRRIEPSAYGPQGRRTQNRVSHR